MMKNYIIEEDYANTRIDRWFKRVVSGVPQSFIEKNIRKGNIRVNNKRIKSSYKLTINDEITIKNLNIKNINHNITKNKYTPTSKELKSTTGIFIENNENFVVINKPANIAVQSGTKSKKNILDILRKTKEFSSSTPYTVHRLDKETTGVMIISKNRKYAQLFTSLFRIRKIHKTYLAIVLGNFSKNKGTFIDDLIYYENNSKITTKAITRYEVLDSNNNYSLLKLHPETGRKHQIRKQLLMRGCPVFGDSKYRISTNKIKRNSSLMLHAYKINFSIGANKYKYNADLPEEFKKVLKEKYLKIYQ